MIHALLVLVFILLQGSSVHADTSHDCAQDKDPDLQIKACTIEIRRGGNVAWAYTNRGNAYFAKGNNDRAVAEYSKAIEIDPRSALAYGTRGMVHSIQNENDRAIADYNKAIERDPKNAVFYNNRAWAYFKSGNAAQGLPDAENALELQPDYARALDTRGSIFEALGRREEAIADFRHALSVGGNDPEVQGSDKEALKRLGASQ
jgi:tetratricopeptide (TPR) repeat protein